MQVIARNNGSFAVRCEKHNWFYKGRPPITMGCPECWFVFYFCQHAQTTDPEKQGFLLDSLEASIHHAVEAVKKGDWDFIPDETPTVSIQKDVPDEDVAAEIAKDPKDMN